MKRLNNKGYLLVEIILAFALAMTIMYFIAEVTIKVKNRNDDLLVRTLTSSDQAIIYNMIMKDIYSGNKTLEGVKDLIKCTESSQQVVDIYEDNYITKKKFVFEYNKKKVILNEYVDYCKYNIDNNTISIKVNQLPGENFDVKIS